MPTLALAYLICSIHCKDAKERPANTRAKPAAESQSEIEVITEENEFINSFQMQTVEISPDVSDQSVLKFGKQKMSYPLKFNMKLKYFERVLFINMTMNTLMMSARPKLIYFGENGTLIEEDDPDDCVYYQGYEKSASNKSSTISACSNGLEGIITLNDKRLLVEPSTQNSAMKQVENRFMYGPHLLKESRLKSYDKYKLDFVKLEDGEKIGTRFRRENPSHLTDTKYIQMYFVNDNREFTWLGSRVENNMKRMKQIANLMDSFYYPYNIRAILLGVEVWNDYDKMSVDLSSSATLTNFMRYRNDKILPRLDHDCSLFITRLDFTGATIGLAPMNGMCHPQHSANINQDTGTDFSLVAGTMTHEMGHNLGMDHDADSCPCSAGYGRCFMAPYAQDPIPTTFSDCSTNDLTRYLKGDMARCLMNVPDLDGALYLDGSKCGNNKLDEGEECDCGLPGWCKSPCCDPSTCKYTSGSQCDRGGCCKNCKIQHKGSVCRIATDGCDIEEKCDGVSTECPENLYLQDGRDCKAHNQEGYCKGGRCWSHNSQCQYGWGGQTTQADGACYDLNVRGDKYGNCGISGNYYVRCAHADRYCGKLFCVGRPLDSNLPVVGFDRGIMMLSFTTGGRKVYCDSGSASLGRGEPNPCTNLNSNL